MIKLDDKKNIFGLQLWSKTHNEVWRRVDGHVRNQIMSQIGEQIANQVEIHFCRVVKNQVYTRIYRRSRFLPEKPPAKFPAFTKPKV